MTEYEKILQRKLVKMPENAATLQMVKDYKNLRDMVRCK